MTNKPIIRKIDDVPSKPVDYGPGISIQVLLGPDDGMPNFYMRLFTLEPGAKIPAHMHDIIEHEQVVVEGEMTLLLDGKKCTVKEGDVLYLPPKMFHSLENRGSIPARFLCMIPAVAAYSTEWAEPKKQ